MQHNQNILFIVKLNKKLIAENKLVIYCFKAEEIDTKYRFKKKFKYKIESGNYQIKAYSKNSKMYKLEGFEVNKTDFKRAVFTFKDHSIKLKKPNKKTFLTSIKKYKRLSRKEVNSFKELREFDGLENHKMRSSLFDIGSKERLQP